MTCASCGRANRAGARFCRGCGRPLAPRCPACGAEGEAGARFCDACGASLAVTATDEGARKVVTIVFADLAGSTALHERLDAESARRFMDRYYRAMQGAVNAHGGTVTQLLGDGVKAVFGAPRVAEDDALRAVRAAVAMQAAFRELAAGQGAAVGRVGLRVAVHTGEVVAQHEAEIIGDPVNVAARLQQEARDGDVLVGESTRRLVGELVTLAPFGTFALKGRSEPVSAWRVVSLARPAGAAAVAFVGREAELERLLAVHEAAVAAPGARLAVILGSPGLGKSRLLAELARRLGDGAHVLTARCDAAGATTFAPVAEALRAWLGGEEGATPPALRESVAASIPGEFAERARIADGVAALLAGAPAPPEETFFVVRRLLASLAATRPVLLAIDDLHWAEPLLLDLVEHLVQWGAGVPLLVVAAARPELREVRASLASFGGAASEVVTLAGLDAGAAARLAANVIGADELPAAIAGRVLATSEGNPLFVGELVRMLVHDGALRREGGRWTAGVELSGLEMPPTIHALLGARIERLRPEERTVLERAAVVGRHFSRSAVAELLPPEQRAEIDARLESLRRSELVEPDRGWWLGEPALRFHHALIRDAAYRRVLKGTRAELHERLAGWLEGRAGDGVEHEETIGWHLEQAHRHLHELGPIDARGRTLGERAARHLASAGRRALARDDLPLAAGLLGRAIDRLDPADPERAGLALDWCEALLAAGEVGAAPRAIGELGRFAGGSERLSAWHTCFTGQLAVLTDPKALRATADAVAAASGTFASAGDAAGEAKAHAVHALALVRLGAVGEGEAALDRALAAARRARDRRRANAVLEGAPLAALWGPSPVTRASGRCLDVVRVLRITQGAPAVEAVALRCQAVLEALRGRTDAARRMIASSRRMVEELGIAPQLLEADVFAGQIALLEGDAAAAKRSLRPAYEGLRQRGLGIDAARAAALLGRALLAQGRAAEAEALSHESETLAGDDLQAAIAWRGVRAEALARRGEHAAAIELARAAVEIAAATDALLDHADARVALAAALRAAGRRAEADAEETRAVGLWDAKGATLLSERARGGVARADAATAAGDPGQRIHPVRTSQRRVRENAATAIGARLRSAALARDEAAIAALCADDLHVLHHPTGARIDREAGLQRFRLLGRSEGLELAVEILATLGDSLTLSRDATSFDRLAQDGLSFGASRSLQLTLLEANARGQCARVEVFGEDRLGEAVSRLYERHAELLPDGPGRARAEATARSVATVLGTPDVDRLGTALAPDAEFADHRTIGFRPARGAEALLRGRRALFETSDDVVNRVDDVLAARSDALLVRLTTSGRQRTGGGAWEKPGLVLWVLGSEGLVARIETFDADRTAEALARFAALAAEPPSERFANAATRAGEQFEQALQARDWERLIATFGPGYRLIDRRGMVQLDLDRDRYFESLRRVFEMRSSRHERQVLATRGDRLALIRMLWSGSDQSVGPSELEWLSVHEVDATGNRVATVAFDVADLDAAYAELDARYVAGEGAPWATLLASGQELLRVAGAPDPAALARLLPADFTVLTHRRIASVGNRMTRDEYLASISAIERMGVRGRIRVDHFRISEHAAIADSTWTGIRDGGAFELANVIVLRHDGRRVLHLELFDDDQLDAALARFAELSARVEQTRLLENDATRSADRTGAAWRARDWPRLASLFAPGFRLVDRRTWSHVDLDRERHLESLRSSFDMPTSRYRSEVLATRGERLALSRLLWSGARPGSGPSEIEWLEVAELDAEGRFAAIVTFEPADLDAAHAELDARYAAGEAAAHPRVSATMRAFRDAFAARDWDALAAVFTPDLVGYDHRRLGWEPLRGPEAYVRAMRSLVELAPDTGLRLDHVRTCARGLLWVARWLGTREGGPFEASWITVSEHDAKGVVRRFDQYDLDQLQTALARYGELDGRSGVPEIERAVPNAARGAAPPARR
jgi:class 3 adenylate cyclase/tetratricopeptide (TPR) repeat protein